MSPEMEWPIIEMRIKDAKQCVPNIFGISVTSYHRIINHECSKTMDFSYESWRNFIRQYCHDQIKIRCETLQNNTISLLKNFRNMCLAVKYKNMWFHITCRPPNAFDQGGRIYKLCESRFKSNIGYINVE